LKIFIFFSIFIDPPHIRINVEVNCFLLLINYAKCNIDGVACDSLNNVTCKFLFRLSW